MKILLVDDEVEFVTALSERLLLRGFETDWTTKPEEAVRMVEDRHYDLVLIDVKMPELDGISLKIKLMDLAPHLKFIFVTGHGSEEEYHAASSEKGVEFYLLKPIQIDELVMKIRAATGEEGGSRNER